MLTNRLSVELRVVMFGLLAVLSVAAIIVVNVVTAGHTVDEVHRVAICADPHSLVCQRNVLPGVFADATLGELRWYEQAIQARRAVLAGS